MAFPAGWPPRPSSGARSIRFYAEGTTSADWSDNALLFIDGVKANPYLPTPYVPPGGERVQASVGDRTVSGSPMGTGENPNDVYPGSLPNVRAQIWASSIRIYNDGLGDLEFSFTSDDNLDNEVHGVVLAGKEALFRMRLEAGIALRSTGAATAYRVEAW
jgi:hypothetical protein